MENCRRDRLRSLVPNGARSALYYRLRKLHRMGVPWPELEKARDAYLVFANVCDACGGSKCGRWNFDHDHTTKKFRGIVGGNCNRAIGMVKDNPDALRSIATYLER